MTAFDNFGAKITDVLFEFWRKKADSLFEIWRKNI